MTDWTADQNPLPRASQKARTSNTARFRAYLLCRLTGFLLLAVFMASGVGMRQAWAQAAADTATLIVRVRNSQGGMTPVIGAAVNLSSETERPRSRTTDAGGLATFPELPAGTYSVQVTAVGFRTPPRRDNIVVVEGRTGTVDFELVPVGPTELDVTRRVELVERTNTSEYARRSRAFWETYPVGVGNQQSLNRILRTVPGFVPDSLDQVHARGESAITNSTYIDGFLVPQFAALPVNRAFFLPDSIDLLDIQTAGYAPEVGQASGSVTNITTRATPYYLMADAELKVGSFGTFEDYVTFGGSLAGSRDDKLIREARRQGRLRTLPNGQYAIDGRVLPDKSTRADASARNLSYSITASQRFTDYGSETPQRDGRTANNSLASEILFGKLEYKLNPQTSITGLFNYSTARTQSPNRTGLDGFYAPFGQGFGFGGLQTRGLGYPGSSQDEVGYGVRQKDNDNFNLIQAKRTFKNGARLSTSFGYTQSNRDTDTQSAGSAQALNNLPADGPVEFLPTLNAKYEQVAIQADYTLAPIVSRRGRDYHNFKFGVLYHDITANEGYQLIPQSQTALNALAQVEPALAPNGSFVNGRFVVDPNNPQSPVLTTRRSGYYGAVYAQDTWRISAPLTLNYGVRADLYEMNIDYLNTNNTSYGGNKDDRSDTEISPRASLALVLPQSRLFRFVGTNPTILRVSYNRLFVTPSLGQGDIIPNQGARAGIPGISGSQNNPINGQSVAPQKTDLYDASLEHQFGSKAVGKATVYYKDIDSLVSSQQLIPLVQSGLLSTVNLGDASVTGAELTFEFVPPRPGEAGFHGYLTYANSESTPRTDREFTNLGALYSTPYLEWDQADTLNLGLAYTTKSGLLAGLNFYYGAGTYSSALTNNGNLVRDQSDRQEITEVNLRLASGQRFTNNRLGFEFQVENLFNSRSRMNWQSFVTGTRFQQERRIMGSIKGRF